MVASKGLLDVTSTSTGQTGGTDCCGAQKRPDTGPPLTLDVQRRWRPGAAAVAFRGVVEVRRGPVLSRQAEAVRRVFLLVAEVADGT